MWWSSDGPPWTTSSGRPSAPRSTTCSRVSEISMWRPTLATLAMVRRRMRRGRLAWMAALGALLAPVAARADDASLYRGADPRPGPDILYAPPADAPQLHNSGPWQAEPILVSGAGSYRDGEYVYQDFLYDDHGASSGQRDPDDPRTGNDTFSQPNGTYTYPTDPVYAQNAAD